MAVDHPGIGFSIEQLMRMVRREVVATLQNASIGRAGIRVYDGGWILIEGGGLSVTGKQTVSGELEGTGKFVWIGPWELRGNGKITGDTEVTGKLRVTGDAELGGNTVIKKDLDVQAKTRLRGKTTLEDDLEVLPGGKIKAGNMIIDTTGGGSVTFANGARVGSSGSTVSILMGTSSVTVDNNSAMISAAGRVVEVNGSGIRFSPSGVPQLTGTGLTKNMLLMDPSTGQISRVYS